ncbi:MAG: DUF3054 domain-containing protein [Terracoccus sp.]
MNRVLDLLRRPAGAALADLVLVILFAAVGRASHDEGNPVVGALSTAWPFLVGTAIGWLLVRLLRRSWPLEVGPGITVWFATLVFGMLLRQLTGQGTAASFVVVAAAVLAVFLVGWRALVALGGRARGRKPARSEPV